MNTVIDQPQRNKAIDPGKSFLVQAPAGSGKTALLTLRFLKLLTTVEAPEEIIAITFTRKAAAEMRHRIVSALEMAEKTGVNGALENQLRDLAMLVMEKDRQYNWQLMLNPGRLRIFTIDSLCSQLIRQMPVLSRFGVMPAIEEKAHTLYMEAAAETIEYIEDNSHWGEALSALSLYLDNRLERLQNLVAEMLARREQWFHYLPQGEETTEAMREKLELTLATIIEDQLGAVDALLGEELKSRLLSLLGYAAKQLDPGQNEALEKWQDLTAFPLADAGNLTLWQALADVLLTGKGEWRKQVNKRQGFPTGKGQPADMKEQMKELLDELRADQPLQTEMSRLREMLPAHYEDQQWQILQALFTVLKLASVELQLIFRQHGKVDFQYLSAAATGALGTEENPSDLALALDYRIRHLLVDEFQDTSRLQYQLLQGLTAGWQDGDGRTLFLVGDPMQSIYRFREANVSLFMQTRDYGIGQIKPEFLQLQVNFRSEKGIIDWVNSCFRHVMPKRDILIDGAVSYSPSEAYHHDDVDAGVSIHAFENGQRLREAERIVELVQDRQRITGHRTAILVRNRSQLADTVALLQDRKIPFQAVEIEPLAHRQLIQDLLALTRALLHPGDRVAWFAVLRAPWCGLKLDDLEYLANSGQPVLLQAISDKETLKKLSLDGQARLARCAPVLVQAFSSQQRQNLRALVEYTWLALGGPACVRDDSDLEDAEVFFRLLEKSRIKGRWDHQETLEEAMASLYALPNTGEHADKLQIMTIHKAKGLEFDTVILPALGRKTRNTGESLLNWAEVETGDGDSLLFMAPIKAGDEQKSAFSKWFAALEKTRQSYEDGRLLYVAATRARKSLHLLAEVSRNKEGDIAEPLPQSLLARCWPVLGAEIARQLDELPPDAGIPAQAPEAPESKTLYRLADSWKMPALTADLITNYNMPSENQQEEPDFDWARMNARLVGNVVHRLLQHIGERELVSEDIHKLPALEQFVRRQLQIAGMANEQLGHYTEKCLMALTKTLADKRGQWILQPGHQQSAFELALTYATDKRTEKRIIDRTFIDEEGTRWIIDYKTGTHSGAGLEEFLDQEVKRYRPQLEEYARIMRCLENRPIRLALYFPLLQAWREWPASG